MRMHGNKWAQSSVSKHRELGVSGIHEPSSVPMIGNNTA